MRRRRLAFRASLVVTTALALAPGCDKDKPKEREPTHNPPAPEELDAGAAVQVRTEIPDPDPRNPGGAIVWRAASQDCWRVFSSQCDPGVKCNPPEPERVPCPDELLPRK